MIYSSNYYRDPHTDGDPIAEAIEELQRQVRELNTALSGEVILRRDADTALGNTIERLPANAHEMAGNRYSGGWYIVDNVDGNDNNDGSDWDKAFKTLKACIDYANAHGSHDLRIALVESATPYEYPYAAIATGALHLASYYRITHEAFNEPIGQGDTTPVTVNVTNTDRPLALYCTHANIKGITFNHVELDNNTYVPEIYSDGGMVLLSNCKFNCRYSQNGGTFWTTGSFFNQLRVNYCVARFYGQTTFSSEGLSVDTGYRLDVQGSQVTFGSSASYSLTMLGGLARLFKIDNSVVSFGSQMIYSFTTPTSDIPWSIDNSVIFMRQMTMDELQLMSNYKFTDSLLIQGLNRISNGTVISSDVENNAFVGG